MESVGGTWSSSHIPVSRRLSRTPEVPVAHAGRRDRMTCHGLRAIARTILDEVLGFRPDFVEHRFAHAVCGDPNGRAYNRYGVPA